MDVVEYQIKLDSSILTYTLKKGQHYCLLCRISLTLEDLQIEQIVPIKNLSEYDRYMAIDIEKNQLHTAYLRMKKVLERWLSELADDISPRSDIPGLIYEIAESRDEDSVLIAMKGIREQLGAKGYLFTKVRYEKNSSYPLELKFLIDHRPEWLQIYQDRHWYLNDVFLKLFETASRIVTSLELHKLSPGQQAMLEAAQNFEMQNIVAIPAFSPKAKERGVLLVFHDYDYTNWSRSQLNIGKHVLRAAAMELLLFFDRRKKYLNFDIELDSLEIDILRMAYTGSTGGQIAKYMDLPVRKIYSLFSGINSKFQTSRITESAAIALQQGLFSLD